MLFRRSFERFKDQNWHGVTLDLVVVIVGIFLAFQVDRWYDNRRMQSSLQERLVALAEDFTANRESIDRSFGLQLSAETAARQLLKLGSDDLNSVDHDTFYSLLADASRSGAPTPVRRAYDALISTGEIELIQNEKLRVELAAFYARHEELRAFGQGAWQFDRRIFEPYVIRELDHVAMLKHLHPSQTETMELTRPRQQFEDVLGSPEFAGVISGKWHVASDYVGRFETIRQQIDLIDELISEEKSRSEGR